MASTGENQIIRQLRRKFVMTAMTALLIIVVSMVGVINLLNLMQIQRRSDEVLGILSAHDGAFPMRPFEDRQEPPAAPPFENAPRAREIEMPFETRYFSVTQDGEGNITSCDLSHIAFVTEDSALYYAQQVSGEKGQVGSYRYLVKEQEDGTRLTIFVDQGLALNNAKNLFFISVIIALLALAAMLALVSLFAGRAVLPAVEAMEKQKQFISDAGHELKTPLSVILSSVDVLELEGTKNKWTNNIRAQIAQLKRLIDHMLMLSRMEDSAEQRIFTRFDVSAAVADACHGFEAVAAAGEKRYTTQITEGIFMQGDEDGISELTRLLIDNAMKYSPHGGSVSVQLRQETGNRSHPILLQVENDCDKLPDVDPERLFDRFYRADSSRSRKSGGHGIGLAVARAIVNAHGGNIQIAFGTMPNRITIRALL
ncbi:MAG: two-component sensor histidine kinase [Lachnospiraceae bacterium]|nr:two-component sensor histidine kinase [Lachnospiraceae bacterium]